MRPESDADKAIDDWTRDGRYVIFGNLAAGRKREEWALPLFGDRKPFPVIAGTGTIQGPQVSPNGKWIAYTSDESGAQEIYVQTFPPSGGNGRSQPTAASSRWQEKHRMKVAARGLSSIISSSSGIPVLQISRYARRKLDDEKCRKRDDDAG